VSEARPDRLKPSTRINVGLVMLIDGFACVVFSMLIPGLIGFGLMLTFPAGLILVLTGVFQMIRGLRERQPDTVRTR
jgi:predicted phage tail protein